MPKWNTPSKKKSKNTSDVIYGELCLIGGDQDRASSDSIRRRSKQLISRRNISNGINPELLSERSRSRSRTHTIAFNGTTLSYMGDDSLDMFQIGRSPAETNDMVLEEYMMVSRFACHMLISRDPPHTARIYAGGFGEDHSLAVHESFRRQGMWDGFTTNGVFIKQAGRDDWMEVSVRGTVYHNRLSRTDQTECMFGDNSLHDGTLIDLCGVTFIWRNAFASLTTPSLNSLRMPTNVSHVFSSCGHVSTSDKCSICHKGGPVVMLRLGMETCFYADDGALSHFFTACGHLTTLATAKFWGSIQMPYEKGKFRTICPFCRTPLLEPPFRSIILSQVVLKL